MHRIVSGIPRYGVDIRERDLPQETEQARALNFNKGCYVGQEIVERIRSRGAVHRKFSARSWSRAPFTRTRLKDSSSAEKKSAKSRAPHRCVLPIRLRTVALGYIRREFGAPGSES